MAGVAFALAFALLLGVASVFSRRGLEREPFYVLLAVSLVVGAPLFVLFTAVTTGFGGAPLRGVLYAAAGAVVGSVLSRSLYFLGISYLGPGKSLSIYATSPLYAAVLAWVILGERITPLVIAGTLGVVVGIVVLSRDVRRQTERGGHSTLVALYPLAGAVLASVSLMFRKLALETGIEPVQAGTVNMVVGLAVVTPLVATRWRSTVVHADRRALLHFAVASTLIAVGFLFYFTGLRVTNASVFFPLVMTQPLFAVVLSAVFLRRLEVITRWTVAGSIVIVGGAVLIVLG